VSGQVRSRGGAAATAALLAAPALIALGTATASHADAAVTNNGPSISAPVQHPAFPHQTNTPPARHLGASPPPEPQEVSPTRTP
jgi:hypothetical protein